MALNQTREHSLLGSLQNDIFVLDLAFEPKTATTVKQAIEEAKRMRSAIRSSFVDGYKIDISICKRKKSKRKRKRKKRN